MRCPFTTRIGTLSEVLAASCASTPETSATLRPIPHRLRPDIEGSAAILHELPRCRWSRHPMDVRPPRLYNGRVNLRRAGMAMSRVNVARMLPVLLVMAGSVGIVRGASPALSQKNQDPAVREMTGTTGPKPIPPDQRAFDAAMQIGNVTDRVLALDKVRRDYPQSSLQSEI